MACCLPLLFSEGVFANASSRYIWYGGVLYGPFAGGTLATLVIDGRLFAQMEQASENCIGYSEDFGEWTAMGSASVTEDQAVAPDGNTTADKLTFTTDAGDGIKRVLTGTVTDDKPQTISVWAKTAAGTQTFRLGFLKKDSNTSYSADKTATTTWQRFDYALSDIVNGGTTPEARIINGTGAAAGDLLIWGAQSENNRKWPSSYIRTLAGSAVTRAGDQFYWARAVVPDCINRGKWRFKWYPFWACGENAIGWLGPNYESDNCAFNWGDGSNAIRVWRTGQRVASNVLDWARGMMVEISLDAERGLLEVTGLNLLNQASLTGKGEVYGTPWDWRDRVTNLLYQGSNNKIDGLISEPY